MKVLICRVCLIAVCIFFAACNHREEKFRVGVSQCSDDEWRHQMNNEMLREALFYDGVDIEIRTSKDNNTKQIEDIQHFIDTKVNLLIVSPNEAAPITPIVEKAYDAGIPVIVVDRRILSNKYTAFVGADNYEIGKAIGRYVAELLNGKGSIVELSGLVGSSPAIDRHEGFMNAITAFPNIHVLEKEDGGWLRNQAEAKMEIILDKHKDIDLVYAHNDRMAAGAYEAAVRKHREKSIRFIGTDALSGEGYGLDDVLKGKMDATFIYPTGGDVVMQTAMNILNGKEYMRENLLRTSVVNKDNALIMKMQTGHIADLDKKIETLNGKINQYLLQHTTQTSFLVASLFALLLVIILLVVLYLSLRSKNRLNKELSLQKEQLEDQKFQLIQQTELLEGQKLKLEEMALELETATHAKLVFFTNISHDFRTPLTLIADPVDQLLQDNQLPNHDKDLLKVIKKNVQILLRLVNQILDFWKMENGKMELHKESFDLLAGIKKWSDAFRVALLKKQITLQFSIPDKESFLLFADVEKMERVFFNLFTNALKYTPENGKIILSLGRIGNNIELGIHNSGSYISPEQVETIFERFYQVNTYMEGTGIGLAMVKAFVEMHEGQIRVMSNTKGTTFLVTLPINSLDENHYFSTSISSEIDSVIQHNHELLKSVDESLTYDLAEDMEPDKMVQQSVLIIDDNLDIRNYLKSFLANSYKVYEASDGAEGIKLAMKIIPDIIVSDVMMPNIDGIECCRRLKHELQTSHIPVILLTARALDEHRIEGYDVGADSYISKPFSLQLLLSRIRNLLENRQQLKNIFTEKQIAENSQINALDKDFLLKFKDLIDKHIQDPELNVEHMGREMGLSRVQLYRKLKSLTNYSPNELLRQLRLKRAVALLSSTDWSIAEIAFQVGFSSPSYFSKCYKETYGESPSDFLKRRDNVK